MDAKRSKPDQYQLRFPPGMRAHLKAAADGNERSLNAEIVARLQISIDADKMEWKEENLRMDVLQQLEDATKQMQHQNELAKWMLEQQKASVRLLEHIAASDGNLSQDFLEALRSMLARRGSEDIDPSRESGGD